MNAPLPFDDDLRIDVLREYEILDTADEAAYDDIVNLAATVCNVPMAAITLIDETRQWFKARVGIGFRDTDRDISFCAYAILKPDQVMIVPDMVLDNRFSLNQMVVSKPNVRFYAGAPLVNPEGVVLGTLCVMDRDARVLSLGQIDSLRSLARQVVALMELRRTQIMIRTQADNITNGRPTVVVIPEPVRAETAPPTYDELCRPANTIIAAAGLLNQTPLTDKQRNLLEMIESNAKNLLGMMGHKTEEPVRNDSKSEVFRSVPFRAETYRPTVPNPEISRIEAARTEYRPQVMEAPRPPQNGGTTQNVAVAAPIARKVSQPRILVADDNEVNCLVITSLLENHGCDVVCVENGEDALQKLATEKFDLVFMDIQMPRLDGIATSRTIRRMPNPICNVPIVALSASIVKDEESRCRMAGMNDFISKPISDKMVRAMLDRWMVREDITALI